MSGFCAAIFILHAVCVADADAAHASVVHNDSFPFRDDIVVVPARGGRADLALLGIEFSGDVSW